MTKLTARALGCALSFSLLTACAPTTGQPPLPPGPVGGAGAVPTGAGNLVGNDGGSVQPNFPPPNLVPGVLGGASVDGAPLAGADVTVYRLGDPRPVATGKTNDKGEFFFELGPQGVAGLALKIVAKQGDRSLAAVGAASMVAAGGGNMVAAGGGNMVAAGGGNMVAAGGGNMVAAGGGNYQLAQAPRAAFVQLNLATTLATVLLAPRLEAAGAASGAAGNTVIAAAVTEMLAAFDAMVAAAATAIASDPSLGSTASAAVNGTLDAASAAKVIANAGLASAFTAAAERLGNAIAAGIDAGGKRPAAETLREITIGGITIPAIRLPAVIPSERDDPGTGTTTPGGTTSGGGSSGGGGSSSGDDGADDEDEDDQPKGMVGLTGNLNQPSYQPPQQVVGGS